VFVRPGELRHAEWTEFDFRKSEWRIPAGTMKAGEHHLGPESLERCFGALIDPVVCEHAGAVLSEWLDDPRGRWSSA
jgi:hypothetical protein